MDFYSFLQLLQTAGVLEVLETTTTNSNFLLFNPFILSFTTKKKSFFFACSGISVHLSPSIPIGYLEEIINKGGYNLYGTS